MDDCIFCRIVADKSPSWKVYEDENTYAFLCIHPVNRYHTLVIPKKHYANMFDIPEDEAVHLMRAVKRVVMLYNEKLGLTDVQIINSSGAAAQQEVFHIHYHIVPRHTGDGQDVVWQMNPDWHEAFDLFDTWMEKLHD